MARGYKVTTWYCHNCREEDRTPHLPTLRVTILSGGREKVTVLPPQCRRCGARLEKRVKKLRVKKREL